VADGVTFTCPDASAGGCIVYNSYDGWTEYGFYSATDPSQYVYLEWPIDSSTDSFSFLTGPGGSYCAGCAPGVDQDFLVSGEAVDPPPTSTPEPATPLMLLAGLAGLGFLGLRRRSIVLAS